MMNVWSAREDEHFKPLIPTLSFNTSSTTYMDGHHGVVDHGGL